MIKIFRILIKRQPPRSSLNLSSRTTSIISLDKSKPNTLAGLPIELLLVIADFLTLDDVICLSLCSHMTFAKLARKRTVLLSRCFENKILLPSARENIPLLLRLQRDQPKYFFCHVCYMLHKYYNSPAFGGSTLENNRCTLRCFPKWKHHNSLALEFKGLLSDIKYELYFLHIQLATRSVSYGPQFGIDTEALSYTQVFEKRREITSLFSVDAEVCLDRSKPKDDLFARAPPEFVLRTQQIFSSPRRNHHLIYNDPLFCHSGDYFICTHIDHHPERLGRLIRRIVRSCRAGKKAPSSSWICEWCKTSFCIEVCDYDIKMRALIITRWMNLGAGLSPDDPKWVRFRESGRYYRWSVKAEPTYDRSNARILFEKSSTCPLDAFSFHNLSYLKDQRYKKVMRKPLASFYRDLWSLQGYQAKYS